MPVVESAIEVSLPPDPQYSSLAALVVGDAATRAGIEDVQRAHLIEAVQLTFDLIVREAMAGAREPIRIRAHWSPAELRVSLLERGLPLDDSIVRRDSHWQAILERVDRAQWKVHGRGGSELRLGVQRPHGIAHTDEPPPAEDTVPLAPEQSYTIRRFARGDAQGVARAFYLTWGYHYIFPAVYVPERLIQLNEADAYVSVVAVAENGEIVGHYALDPVPGAPIADACAAIVVPAHRGRGLLERLRKAAEDEAVRLGFAAYYSEPVTTHGRTQSESAKFGAQLCAIVLGGDPPSFLPKHMRVTGAGQRQSFTVYFKPLAPRETRAIYAPAQHRAIVAKIYQNLGLPVDFRTGAGSEGATDLHVEVVRAEGYATIDVVSPGAAVVDHVAQAVADLRHVARLGAVYVNLPLENPAAPQLCDALENQGFFFCGVVPYAMGGRDSLRMQLPLRPIDLDGVTIIGEFGQELKAYVAGRMHTPNDL